VRCACGRDGVHPECVVAEALVTIAELIAIVVAPTVVVWAG
jgi:hypothetical protein